MNEQDQIKYGNTLIPFTVTRSARRKKTIQISVDATEGVLVAAPLAATAEKVREVMNRRAGWVLLHTASAALTPHPKLFISGETLPYLGREVRLEVTREEIPSVRIRFSHWAFNLSVPANLDGEERRREIRAAFVRWYKRRTAERVQTSVERWAPRLGVSPTRVTVRNQRQRWGSCAPDGTIRFNWRVAMAEPSLLEYIVVHELAHLAYRIHTHEFWATVEQAMPDYLIRRRRLKEAGPWLTL